MKFTSVVPPPIGAGPRERYTTGVFVNIAFFFFLRGKFKSTGFRFYLSEPFFWPFYLFFLLRGLTFFSVFNVSRIIYLFCLCILIDRCIVVVFVSIVGIRIVVLRDSFIILFLLCFLKIPFFLFLLETFQKYLSIAALFLLILTVSYCANFVPERYLFK